ncbi:MAG: ATP-dependent Clp protease adaptor ClpS [Gemmataceae bacterium]|nr:ATP-dependent Clp protease adaptor ClpS [Gemmataceae bacterium]
MSIRPPSRRNDRQSFPTRGRSSSPPPRRFRVVLHKASNRDLVSVVRAVMDVTRFGAAEAEYRVWEAHHRGRSLVLVTHFERAELFVELLAARGLTASVEPA